MNDPELNNIDEFKNKKSINRSNSYQIQYSENYNVAMFNAIKEEPIYENESEYEGNNNKEFKQNIIEETNNYNNIAAVKKKNISDFSSGNPYIKQESTKDSIHVNVMQNSKGNSSNGSVIFVKNSNKKEDGKEKKNINNRNKKVNKANSIDFKYDKDINKNSRISNKRSGSIKQTEKDCIIF